MLGGSIGRVVDFWPSLPFGGSPRGRFCTASSCFSSGSSNLLRRGHHFRWAGILADLCTGKLVFPVSSGVVLAPQTSPSHFLAELGGDFFFPCQVVVHARAYFFTSFRWLLTVSLRPWALGPLTVPLWAIISGRYLLSLLSYRKDVFPWAG